MAKPDVLQMDLLSWVPSGAVSAPEEGLRNSICREWRLCQYGSVCMDDAINSDCICYKDEPDKYTGTIPVFQLKAPLQLPALEELIKLGFSRCQAKVLRGGFSLVRYTREAKRIEVSRVDPRDGWMIYEGYPTFAAAERELKEILDQQENVATGDDGTIGGSSNQGGKINKAGFEFYRVYGLRAHETDFRIKQGSRNWGTFKKCDSVEQLQVAWDELMETDMKALKG